METNPAVPTDPSRPSEKAILIFFDTEFTDLVQDPFLISVGFVSEEGSEFYGELEPKFWAPWANQFVQANVVPLLDQVTHRAGGLPPFSLGGLAMTIRKWIESQEQEVVLVSDAPSYDLPLLLNLFDEANEVWPCNTQKRARYYSMDEAAAHTYYREFKRIGLPQHHALADAKALRAAWSAHGWPQD
ncbi:MAG: 3'-5' exoribonuclease [Betaproteobacteria bacterium]|nr:3'-5' exoribonuclease [Betaproteobacteria bacterium]